MPFVAAACYIAWTQFTEGGIAAAVPSIVRAMLRFPAVYACTKGRALKDDRKRTGGSVRCPQKSDLCIGTCVFSTETRPSPSNGISSESLEEYACLPSMYPAGDLDVPGIVSLDTLRQPAFAHVTRRID